MSHAGAYVAEPRTELVAVCDRREDAIAEFREDWPELDRVAAYRDFDELLDKERPEIVSIATSDHLHADLTLAAVDAGVKAILCEKPIATTLSDADRMIRACADAGVPLSIEYTRRWAPLFVEAKRILDSGTLGRVRTMAAELARQHVNVNVINPGWINTPGERKYASEEDLEAGGKRIPWGRMGLPEDIGKAAAYLASDDADYVTGSVLRVDGGFVLGLTLPEAPE